MSHDLYAAWATTEIVRNIKENPKLLFQENIDTVTLTAFANRESGRTWPIPDGRISANIQDKEIEIAIELKRTNEGLHGVLTAIGQSQAYLHKGYNSSIIIIPKSFSSFSTPGEYIKQVIDQTNNQIPIGVFSYAEPNTDLASPFLNKLICHRPIGFNLNSHYCPILTLSKASNTQWAHLREGSSEAYSFFKYLQTAKRISSNESDTEPNISYLHPELITSVNRITNVEPLKYLSYASGDSLHDIIWRHFWFENVITEEVSKIWSSTDPYIVQDACSKLILDDRTLKKFFFGRTDSVKNKVVQELNEGSITESLAWEKFANNVHTRAHSYREDIDSGLSHLGFLEDDGRPTELGYKFVDICERTGDPYSGQAKKILGNAILKNGELAAFLHYFYKISEDIFKRDTFAFTSINGNQYQFENKQYLNRVKEILAYELNVINTASMRGGQERAPFQGEFAVLSKFGFIGGGHNRFRLGNGLLINWPLVQEYLSYEI